MSTLSIIVQIVAIAIGLLAAAFAFAVAHDTRKPSHRRVAQWILLASLAAIPVFAVGYLAQLIMAGAPIQFGGKYSTTHVTFQQSPYKFALSGFIALVVSAMPLVLAWPVIGTLFRRERNEE